MALHIIRLEERIVLDGAGAGAVAEAAEVANQDAEAIESAENHDDSSSEKHDAEDSEYGTAVNDLSDQRTESGGEEILTESSSVLVISDSLENADQIIEAAKDNVLVIRYSPIDMTAETLLKSIQDVLGSHKVESIAFACAESDNNRMELASDSILSNATLAVSENQQQFWNDIGSLINDDGHIDLLCDGIVFDDSGELLLEQLETASGCNVAANGNAADIWAYRLDDGEGTADITSSAVDRSETESKAVTVGTAGGQSFAVNHASIESVEFMDVTKTVISGTSTEGDDSVSDGINVVLIDTTLTDYQDLADAAEEGTHVIGFNGDTESADAVLARAVDYATNNQESIDSISIMAHGLSGEFKLGNEWIGANDLADHAEAWHALDGIMNDGGNIYLYGCNVAQDSEAGQALLDGLAEVTHADIFASDDITGAGGDWDLEAASTGDEAEAAEGLDTNIDYAALEDYQGSLANPPVFVSAETIDNDGDGQIDYIKITTDEALNDDFSGLSMTVAGYTLDPTTPYVTNIDGGGAADNVFYIKLVESGAPDTNATPAVILASNTTLGNASDNLIVASTNSDTGWNNPTAEGEDYNDWFLGDQAYESDILSASEMSQNDENDWYNFGLNVPAGAIINGIEVKIEGHSDNLFNDDGVWVRISSDGGNTYGDCENKSMVLQKSLDADHYVGNSTDLWGKAWTADDFSDTNFRLKLQKFDTTITAIWVDEIQVKVHYTDPVTITADDLDDPTAVAGPAITVNEGQTVAVSTADLGISDMDTAAADVDISVTATNGQFLVGGNPSTTFTLAQLDAGDVQFVHDGSENTPTFTVTADDGTTSVGPIAGAVTFSADVNDAPVMNTGVASLCNYNQGDGAKIIDLSIAIVDVDDTHMESATIQISGNFQSGEDVLSIDPANVIAGVTVSAFDTNTGSLTLTADNPGTIPSVQFGIMLQNVKYTNTSDTPDPNDRIVSWTVNDGDTDSNVDTTTIEINCAPVIVNSNLTLNQGETVILSTANFSATDVDNVDGNLRFGVFNIQHGQFQWVSDGSPVMALITQSQIEAGEVQFVHDGSGNAPSFDFGVWDDVGISSVSSVTIDFNSMPVLSGLSGTLNYNEGDGPQLLDSSINLTDVDDDFIENATIQISGNFQTGEDVLSIDPGSVVAGVTVSAFDTGTGTLTLTADSSETITKAQFETMLEAVQYTNSSEAPNTGNRTVSWIVNDGDADSNVSSSTITVNAVNDAPVINTGFASLCSYNQGDGAKIIDLSIFISDDDDTHIESATIQISGNFQSGEDVLSIDPANVVAGVTVSAFDTNSGSLTLTADNPGTIPSVQFGIMLQTVKYTNTSGTPDPNDRTVSWTVNDGDTDSNVDTTTIEINCAPVIVNSNLTLNQGETVILSTANFSATDVDNVDGNLKFGVFNIQHGQFQWVSDGSPVMALITQSQIAAGEVQFVHDGSENAPSFDFGVWDDVGVNSVSSVTINFNSMPILSGLSSTLNYNEGDGLQLLDSTISLADVDDNFIENATIQISGNFQTGEDVLSIDPGSVVAGVTVSAFDTNTGTLTLTADTAETITKAQFETMLEAVQYTNSSEAPNTGNRTVSWIVNDGDMDSNVGSSTIIVNAVNDAPNATAGSMTINEDAAPTTVTLTGFDLDSGDSVETYRIDSLPANGTLRLNGNAVSVNDTVTQLQISTGLLKFEPNPDWNGSTSLTFSAHDGDAWSAGSATFSITVNAANDAPVANAGSVTLNEDTSATITLTGTDIDSGDSVETYRIDSLPANGTLNLNNAAVSAGTTVTQAQISAGNLTFDPDPDWYGSTSFTFSANDGDIWSAGPATFSITVASINDAPIALAGDNQTVNAGDIVILDAIGSSDPEGLGLTYTWTQTGGPAVTLVSANASQPTFTSPDIFDAAVLTFQVQVSDGIDVSIDTVQVTVNPIYSSEITEDETDIEDEESNTDTNQETEDSTDSGNDSESDDEEEGVEDVVDERNEPSPGEVSGAGEGNDAPSATTAEGAPVKTSAGDFSNDRWGDDAIGAGSMPKGISALREDDAISSFSERDEFGKSMAAHGEKDREVQAFTPETMFENSVIWQAMDSMKEQMQGDSAKGDADKSVGMLTIGGMTGLTTVAAGIATWFIRGVSLLSSFLTSLPLWRSFDPLPILDSRENDKFEETEEEKKDTGKDHDYEEGVASIFDDPK